LVRKLLEVVHNHHNFAWHEKHGDEMLWVVRKEPRLHFPERKGFVGGSMGEQSVILEGVENENAKLQSSTPPFMCWPGYGRKRSSGVFDRKTGECKASGKVTQGMMRSWIDRSGIELRGGGLDESPDCYKRLDEVLASVSDSVRILHRLTPVGVAMASGKRIRSIQGLNCNAALTGCTL